MWLPKTEGKDEEEEAVKGKEQAFSRKKMLEWQKQEGEILLHFQRDVEVWGGLGKGE